MNLDQKYKNYKIKVMQLLYSTTKTVVLDNFLNPKQRINNCNHQPIIIQKGVNLMKTNKIILKKRRNLLTHDKKLLQNRKL